MKHPEQLVLLSALGRHYGSNMGWNRISYPMYQYFRGSRPLAVLSYGYWRSRFAGDRAVIGRKIELNGRPFSIVGVSPAGFSGTDPGYAPQVRVPMMMAHEMGRFLNLNDRRSRWVTVFARLKPGESIDAAKAGLQPLFHQILWMEVQQKEFAKASVYMKEEFLKMSMDVLPAAKGPLNCGVNSPNRSLC